MNGIMLIDTGIGIPLMTRMVLTSGGIGAMP